MLDWKHLETKHNNENKLGYNVTINLKNKNRT